MKKGSSGNRNKTKRPAPPREQKARPQQKRRYPTRDNVYSLQQERQKREALERQRERQRERQSDGGQIRKKRKRTKSNPMRMIIVVLAMVGI